MANTRQIFKPRDKEGVDRQKLLAQAMMEAGSAGAPQEWNRMRVVPKYGAGHALTQLAQAMGGAYLQKKAGEADKDIDAERRRKLAEAMGIPSMTKGYELPEGEQGPVRDPNNLPQARENQQALQQFNNTVPLDIQEQIMQTRAIQKAFPAPPKKFSGTLGKDEVGYVDGQEVARGPQGAAPPPKLMRGYGPDGQPMMVPEEAGQRPYIDPQAPQQPQQKYKNETRTLPDGRKQDGVLDQTTGVFSPQGEPYSTPRMQISAKDRGVAKTKLIQLNLAKEQLAKMKRRFEGVEPDKAKGVKGERGLRNSLSAGLGGKYLWTESGTLFDASVDAFRETIQGLLRVPGIGANSDFETRLSQAKLPTRNDREEVIADRIASLDAIVSSLEQGYTGLLEDAGPEPGAEMPQAPQPPPGGPPVAPRFNAPLQDRVNTYKQGL